VLIWLINVLSLANSWQPPSQKKTPELNAGLVNISFILPVSVIYSEVHILCCLLQNFKIEDKNAVTIDILLAKFQFSFISGFPQIFAGFIFFDLSI
jgi:hypothetical protein